MMKYFLFTLILCLLLTGCGRKEPQMSHFSVSRNDTQITLDAPAEPVLKALGAPFGYGEYRSGAHSGVEKSTPPRTWPPWFSGCRTGTRRRCSTSPTSGRTSTLSRCSGPPGKRAS